MKSSKTFRTLCLAFACAAFTFSPAVRAQGQTVNFLYDFHATGQQSQAISMIQGTDGNFYGAADGGANNEGQIFRMTPAGQFTTIYNFCSEANCADGQEAQSSPILGSDGNLYGVADGGSGESGTVYKMTLGGHITTLYTFCANLPCNDGQGPTGVTLASDGNFYGTTAVGGKFDSGTIYSLSPTGTFKLLHTFCSQSNCADGARPSIPPIQGIDGNFYGTTIGGGANGFGVMYKVTSAGIYTVLHDFCSESGCTDGSQPTAIVKDSKGNFFGITASGGTDGTLFQLTSKNQYKILHSFQGWDGENPTGLTLASNGTIYGVTASGGGPSEGTLFKVTSAGVFKSFFVFRCCKPVVEGYDPAYGLFQATNGNFYGTTLYGGPPCCYGTIFSVSDRISPLVETVPAAGKVGKQVIILGNGLKGSTSVKFNGKSAAFTVVSDTYIKATVPAGATTGTVAVITPSGTLNSNPQFVVTK